MEILKKSGLIEQKKWND